jgi:VWFA-related protein
LDKDRKPVRGLTAADFVVKEDGKPQAIANFVAIEVPPQSPPPTAAWMHTVSPDTATNAIVSSPEGRLFVLLIDDAMIPPDPAMIANAKKIGRGVIDRLSPNDQVAVVFTFASRTAQDFTTDRKKLLTAIDSLAAGPASHMLGWDMPAPNSPLPGAVLVPAVDSDSQLRQGSMTTLRLSAETLIAAPQRRKSLIYVSPGLTVDVVSDARPVRIVRGSDPGLPLREANHRLVVDTSEVYRRLQRANVTVYSIDPCGLGGLEGWVTTKALGLGALRGPAVPLPVDYNWLNPTVPPRPMDLAHHKATVDMDFLQAAAANTGGRAIVNTNDFEPGLNQLFEENGSYYLVGYVQPAANKAGSFHRLEVEVNRPGVKVRTRNGYEVPAADAAARDAAERGAADVATIKALSESGAGPVADAGVPLSLALAPVAAPGNTAAGTMAVTVVVGARQDPVASRTPQTLDLQVSVFTPDGIAVGRPQRQQATLTLLPGGSGEMRYELVTQVPIKQAGRYTMRVAMVRATDGLHGSVYADVEVPDFAKAPLSMSGVWLEIAPGVLAVPREGLPSLIPFVPTSSRSFDRSGRLNSSFRVYQGGSDPLAPVALAVRITNDRNAVLANSTGTIGLDRFEVAARAASHRFEIPLNVLEPGRYLLTFELTKGASVARRDVIFEVK